MYYKYNVVALKNISDTYVSKKFLLTLKFDVGNNIFILLVSIYIVLTKLPGFTLMYNVCILRYRTRPCPIDVHSCPHSRPHSRL